jgi:hypothetical protein
MIDDFMVACKKLNLDHYKVADTIHHSNDFYKLSKEYNISHKNAELVYNLYWSSYSQS